MQSWDESTTAERTLLRAALWEQRLAGTAQRYGTELRWAGAAGVPALRSLTVAEQRALVPELAAAALGLAERGLLTVRVRKGVGAGPSDPLLDGAELRAVLADPGNWLWQASPYREFDLRTPEGVADLWYPVAFPVAEVDGLPSWDGLPRDRQEVLVCAAESSGLLTGPFGIWEGLPGGLDGADREAWVEGQLAPLVPFVREGWIEVRHFAAESEDAFTVVPLEGLRAAFADPVLRHDGGSDWGVGFTCVFTHAGLAVWRAGWGAAWGSRLAFD
ncbi:hypothetical protein [Kitasatospora camelliae]|uniref:Uncharacterized protein n=1 Tax=Kitasatospora camelliae TaxID=3156397 RepID=A0AAU8K3Y2_9ACTN